MNETKVVLYDLPCSIRGFTKKTGDTHVIVLNSRLSREQNEKTLLHELEHIQKEHLDAEIDINKIELQMHEEISLHKDIHT